MIRAPAIAPLATPTMRRALSDPALLGDVLRGESWQAWRVLLIALMGEQLTEAERAIFARLTGRAREPLQQAEEFWAVVGRRGGKSRAMAVLIVFLACFVDYCGVIAIGERPVVLCLGQNAKQASIVYGYVVAIIEATPLLATLIKTKLAETLSLTNGVEIEIRAASFRGIRGITAVAIVADEICYWYSDETGSANPDSAILDAVRPSLATTGGPLIAISSPYARRGEAYATWSRHFGEKGDPRILVAQGTSRDLNPSLPQSVIDRAMERDPVAASAEYLAQFRSDLEAFVNIEAVQACISTGVYERAPLSSVSYHGFIDPSGGSSDSMTMACAHVEDGLVILDCIREIQPPFSPEAAVAAFVQVLKSYRVTTVRGDRYAGEWPREQFQKLGISYEPSDKTRSEIYGALLPAINSRKVDLLDDKRLVSQLVGLERRTSRAGKDAIDHAPGRHDDVANSCAGALVFAAAGTAGFGAFLEYLTMHARRADDASPEAPGLPWRRQSAAIPDDGDPSGGLLDEYWRVRLGLEKVAQGVKRCGTCGAEIGSVRTTDGFGVWCNPACCLGFKGAKNEQSKRLAVS